MVESTTIKGNAKWDSGYALFNAAIKYFDGLPWNIQEGTGVSIPELVIDFEISQSVLLLSKGRGIPTTWEGKIKIFLAMIRKLKAMLPRPVHPGVLKYPTYKLFTLNVPRCSGIVGARPKFRARAQVEDVILQFAKSRIGRPRVEPRAFRIPPPGPSIPFPRNDTPYSLAPRRRITGKSAARSLSSGPL